MARYSQKIKGKYGTENFQDTKKSYDWIIKSLKKGNFQNLEVDSEFLFRTDGIRCSCKGIEEFVENAYGFNDYSFIQMDLFFNAEGISLSYISLDCFSDVQVSADTRSVLEKVVSLLRNTSLDEIETNNPTATICIEHQDNSVTVSGNNNAIANNHSTVTETQEKPKSASNDWLHGILQSILANAIWAVLGIIGMIILALLAAKSF